MDLVDALVLKGLKGVGDDTINVLLNFSASNHIQTLEELAKSELPLKRSLPPLEYFLASGKFESDRKLYFEKITNWKQQGIEVLLKGESIYPIQLLELKKPPPFLFCKGRLELLKEKKAIAVVGTRENTIKGEQITKKTVEEFSKCGFTIVSGLALGIDTHAHRTALEFHAPTIAVIVDLVTVSPSSNRLLAESIVRKGGLLISENPPGTKAIPAFFAKRDRIQAGLSAAVFAIETSIDGGTMHAVNASRSIGRPVFVPDALAAGYSDPSIRAITGTQHLVTKGRATPYTRDSYPAIRKRLEEIYASFDKKAHDG